MSDTVQMLREAVDAALEHAHTFTIGSSQDAAELDDVLQGIEEAQARLAAAHLRMVHDARLACAESVIDRVRNDPRRTIPQAAAHLRLASDLDRFTVIADALADGDISVDQAEAIISGLRRLPLHFGRVALEECQEMLLGFCDRLGPTELRIAAVRMWQVKDPEGAEEAEARRLAREERRAKAGRSFKLIPDYHGSMTLTGKLPIADGALLQAQLDALMPSLASYASEDVPPGVEARRADALVLLAQLAAASGEVPAQGMDRPHVHITLPFALLTGAGKGGAEVFGFTGEQVSAGEARRMACDAGVIPVVLGSRSEPLDVGRERRLVTRGIRTALLHRDQGCAFPHCTARAAACEAHHILPWWAGGPTSLENLVLLCPHHHRLVEPDPDRTDEAQWRIRHNPDTGRPLFIPPRHIDPAMRPREHRRHVLAAIGQPASGGGLCPKPEPPPPPERGTWPSGLLLHLPAPADDPWSGGYGR